MHPSEILALQVGDLDGDSVWFRHRVYKGDIDEPKTTRLTQRVAFTVGKLALPDQWKLRLLGSPAEVREVVEGLCAYPVGVGGQYDGRE